MAKKTCLSYQEIETVLKALREGVPADEAGYRVLLAFGKTEADIRRYREGKGVITSFDGLLIKGLFCYRSAESDQLTTTLERLKQDDRVMRAAPKIIAVSDGETILAYDTREQESYENPLSRMYADFIFFYPLAGVEKAPHYEESEADIKAAERLAKLHDELRAYNEFSSNDDLHDLNIFIARLLFCFFAEDTGIFEENLFTDSIRRFTVDDGSDLTAYLEQAFAIMDKSVRGSEVNSMFKQFPYVNGGLFSHRTRIPQLSRKARNIIIACGELNWAKINPDIFGSMIQAVVNPDERANQGMHYTSVPNIRKVIDPLFMDELYAEFGRISEELKTLERRKSLGEFTINNRKQYYNLCKAALKKSDDLLLRICRMKFFDPACGSGNFLIITYKALRYLEIDILKLQKQYGGDDVLIESSVVSINQFYGIELLDFPHEVAMLSLWLAEHQMNNELFANLGVVPHPLPLKNINNIRCANACRVDWNEVCPHTPDEEVFVFGNPPYLGSRHQDESQKKDMELVFHEDFGSLDYIACWFMKGKRYIEGTQAQCAFVTTNSVCQGLQVALLWKRILTDNVEISFAHTSFKWSNNAKNQAAVTVAIVGLTAHKREKLLFNGEHCTKVDNITAYLFAGNNIFIESANSPICKDFPKMNFGNMPADGGCLLFDSEEKKEFIRKEPESEPYFRKLLGAEEFINGKERWCLWLYGKHPEDFRNMPLVEERINRLREIRLKSSRPQLAEVPHLFAQITQPLGKNIILIPRHSSETRAYIPFGYFDSSYIAADSCMVIGSDDISLFGLLTSKMHMAWVRTVGGKLETRYRYSAQLCYNTFPFPRITAEKKAEIEDAANEVLDARDNHPGLTLAELYAPDSMPADLRTAHNRLDDIIDSCYPGYPFANDEARLETLFRMYEKMVKK